jgi:Cdc6-like AAA superfamily ATPase
MSAAPVSAEGWDLDWQQMQILKANAAKLFSPRTPIATQELFAGRQGQILKLNSTIAQPGAHAIIYGERGVGKTSLANIAPITYHVYNKVPAAKIVAARVNCDGTDSFDTIWRKVFKAIHVTTENRPVGFLSSPKANVHSLADDLQDIHTFTPGEVTRVLKNVSAQCHIVITLDEFDRLPPGTVPRLIADTLKSCSDNQANVTLQIVGVGDSVATLVAGHESVGRHLVEVPLPRMSRDELENIVNVRLPLLEHMEIDASALKFISLVCTGLPYFTHLLGQHAVASAIDNHRRQISKDDVDTATTLAIEDSEREMKSAYYAATKSRQPSSTFHVTLAACALTQHDDFGYFTAANVRDALERIQETQREIATFVTHLDRFCKPEKGGVLQSSGPKHQRRYRFHNPLMQPFVIIRSLGDDVITIDQIKAFAA